MIYISLSVHIWLVDTYIENTFYYWHVFPWCCHIRSSIHQNKKQIKTGFLSRPGVHASIPSATLPRCSHVSLLASLVRRYCRAMRNIVLVGKGYSLGPQVSESFTVYKLWNIINIINHINQITMYLITDIRCAKKCLLRIVSVRSDETRIEHRSNTGPPCHSTY